MPIPHCCSSILSFSRRSGLVTEEPKSWSVVKELLFIHHLGDLEDGCNSDEGSEKGRERWEIEVVGVARERTRSKLGHWVKKEWETESSFLLQNHSSVRRSRMVGQRVLWGLNQVANNRKMRGFGFINFGWSSVSSSLMKCYFHYM